MTALRPATAGTTVSLNGIDTALVRGTLRSRANRVGADANLNPIDVLGWLDALGAAVSRAALVIDTTCVDVDVSFAPGAASLAIVGHGGEDADAERWSVSFRTTRPHSSEADVKQALGGPNADETPRGAHKAIVLDLGAAISFLVTAAGDAPAWQVDASGTVRSIAVAVQAVSAKVA